MRAVANYGQTPIAFGGCGYFGDGPYVGQANIGSARRRKPDAPVRIGGDWLSGLERKTAAPKDGRRCETSIVYLGGQRSQRSVSHA
jgi:hypothetical protein